MDLFDQLGSENVTKIESLSTCSVKLSSSFPCFDEIKKLFRILEIFLILVFATWVLTHVPFAVRISGEYLRQLLNVVVKPLFIFLLGNIIALTLFFKSRSLFQQQNEPELVLDFIENGPYYFTGELNPPPASEEVLFQDKETIFEVKKVVKVHKRSQSENFTRTEKQSVAKQGSCRKELRRSETEKPVRVSPENEEVVDDLSNEEFQMAIEAFIAKQVKFHQEEKLAIVVHASTSANTT